MNFKYSILWSDCAAFRYRVRGKGFPCSVPECGTCRTTRLCLQSVVCYTSSMVVYKCALGSLGETCFLQGVYTSAVLAVLLPLFAFQIVSHEKLNGRHNVASRFSAVQWELACFWNCLFASRVARHDKGTPPKIAGVKCLFFLLAKKMP